MQFFYNLFLIISLSVSSLFITGCGEADYSLKQVQERLQAQNLVGGSVAFNTPDLVVVNDQEQNIVTVSVDTTENVTYSIIGGAAKDVLEIDTETGVLSFIDAIDYIEGESNTYDVVVAVTSASGVVSTHSMSIEVVADITTVKPLLDYVVEEAVQAIAGDGVITQIQARPADATSNITYSLIERDADAFEIDENGNLSFTDPLPNFEATPGREYQLAVVVTDGYGNSVTTPIIVVVLVNNLDEVKPVIETTEITIIENSLGAVPIVVSSAGNGVVDTFTLGGTDVDKFEISSEGVLSFKEARDFETPPSTFSITLAVRDDLGNTSDVKGITVHVSDMDEKFTFTNIQNYTPLVVDKVIGNVVVQANTITSGDLEYVVTEGNEFVEIDSNGKLQFKNVAQTGQNFSVKISVKSQVNGSLSYSIPFNVTVIEDPSQVLPSINNVYLRSKNVRAPIDTAQVITAVHASANGSSTTIVYSLEGPDASKFRVDTFGNLYFNASYTYEARSDNNADNVYEVIVKATDNNNNSAVTETIRVQLEEDLNTIAPVVTSSTFSVQENSVGNLSIQSRSDGNGIVESIRITGGADAALFNIVNKKLLFKTAPDFEAEASSAGSNSYSVSVQAEDSLGNVSAVKALTITVTDMDEQFRFTNLQDHTSLVNDKVIGHISVEAKTVTSGTLEYAVVQGSDMVEIDNSGNLQFKAFAQLGQNFNVTISVKSQLNGSLTISSPFNITVTEDDSLIPPTINSGYLLSADVSAPIDTNQAITTISASPRGSSTSITYSLEGSDASKFRIDTSGKLYFNASYDYYARSDANADNVYEVVVKVTDNNSNSALTQTIRVRLTEDLDGIAPVVTSTTFSVQENSTGSLSIESTSSGNGVVSSYSISGGDDAALFNIVNGKLSFKVAPDFETPASSAGSNTYEVAVQAHDDLGNVSDPKTLSVSVGDIDETLSFSGLQSYSQTAGVTVLGTMSATPNVAMSATITYSIGTGSATFSINESTGVIMFKTAPVFDTSGTNNTYTLTVVAQSQYNGSRSESSPITVTVIPSSYAITFDSEQSSLTMDQSTSVSFPMTASSAAGKTLTYSLENVSLAGVFSIHPTTGTLSVNAPAYDFGGSNEYTAEVIASDDSGNSARRLGTMTVNSVNGTPIFNTAETQTVNENIQTVTTLSASSRVGGTLSYSISGGGDRAHFTIMGAADLSFVDSQGKNYESPDDANVDNRYEVEITVTDSVSNLSVTTLLYVNVQNVDELITGMGYSSFGYESCLFLVCSWKAYDVTDTLKDGKEYIMTLTGTSSFAGDTVEYYLQKDDGTLVNTFTDANSGSYSISGDTLTIDVPNVGWGSSYSGGATVYAKDQHGSVGTYSFTIYAE